MWTDDSEAHIARHGIDALEVEQVLYGRPRLRTAGWNETTLVLGTSNDGRHLLIVVAEAADRRDFVFTAREMKNYEKRLFRERRH